MNLESQFKVIFYSFIYGMFFVSTLKILKLFKFKNKVIKIICEFLFCISHVIIFYYLLYKLDYGILNYYIAIFLLCGGLFCQLLYFQDKKR